MSSPDRASTLAAAFAGALLLLLAPPARAAPVGQATAADKNAARDAYKEGQRLVEARDYDRALVAFKRGYESYEDPIFLFNIAQCHRLSGHKQEAVRYYRAFLEKVPEPPNLADIQRWLARLDAQIEAEKDAPERPPVVGEEPPPAPVPNDSGPSEPTPVYKKWWLWTIVGVVVVGAALGVGLGLGLRKAPAFNQTLADFGPGATKPASLVLQVRF